MKLHATYPHTCTHTHRWRLVIHGGVDGYSRLPVYLSCSDNNQSDTVLRLFKEAVLHYGLPSRVLCDQGGENVGVSIHLLSHPLHGPGCGSVIVGKSVHNQRVARMWRDVYQGVISLFWTFSTIWKLLTCLSLTVMCMFFVFTMCSFPVSTKA